MTRGNGAISNLPQVEWWQALSPGKTNVSAAPTRKSKGKTTGGLGLWNGSKLKSESAAIQRRYVAIYHIELGIFHGTRSSECAELIPLQPESTPDASALAAQARRLSYGQINLSANQVARFFRAKGVEPETVVGLCLRRSVEMGVATLGILKAGGAYVPIDPADPAGTAIV